jgi:hypothetical protein
MLSQIVFDCSYQICACLLFKPWTRFSSLDSDFLSQTASGLLNCLIFIFSFGHDIRQKAPDDFSLGLPWHSNSPITKKARRPGGAAN